MRYYFTLLVVCLLSWACLAQTTKKGTYNNPVIAGDFADPSIIRVKDTYYAAGTSSEWGPAYPMYQSKDLVNWQYVGPIFKNLPSWTMGSYWAPELFYRNNTFFVYYTARRKSDQRSYIGVASTKDLSQGFTDHGLLLEWTSEAIDAFVLEDAGKLYITWKAYGLDKGKAIQILGRELTQDGLKVTGDVFTLLQAEPKNWEAGGAEGQAIFKRGQYYYMTYSGNTCCGPDCNYQVGIARAEKLQGPWEKFAANPIMQGGESWKCPGHGTVVTTPDNRYFYLHHAYSATDFTNTGRQAILSELIWDDKTNWPTFKYGNTPPAQAEAPFPLVQKQNLNVTANFDNGEDEPAWVWDVSQPKPELSLRNGNLQITSSNAAQPAGTFLGLVIKKGDYKFSAEIIPQAKLLQSICVYGDAKNAVGFGVTQDSLELWWVKDGKRKILQKQAWSGSKTPVTLMLSSSQGKSYLFSWQSKNNQGAINQVPLDGSYLPRWDRAPRVGLSIKGENNATALVSSVKMLYK